MRKASEKPLGLNALGRPFSPSYDPHYKLRSERTKTGRLYAPYGRDMRFVGDPPKSETEHRRERRYRHRQQLPPAPLFGLPEPNDTLDMMVAAKFLSGIEKMINTLRRAMLKAVEKSEQAAMSQAYEPKKPSPAPVNTILALRAELDLIERLESVRGILETSGANGMPVVLVDNALRAAVDHLVQGREQRLTERAP